MNEHHLTIRRTARYYSLGDTDSQELWIVCHGYAQLARYFMRSFTPLDDGARMIVAPEALNRYYYETAPGVHTGDARIAATWMTREDREHEIEDYIAYLDTLASHVATDATRTVIALGYSQGAATVCRWVAHGSARIDHVILWGSPVPPELEPAPSLLRGAALTIAIGESDGQIPPGEIERQDERLRSAGMAYDLVRYAGGHSIEGDALLDIAARVRRTRTRQ
ncbi:MAG: dienelactone hydrolase family protein [Gemmatimonadetes bacterium]|nr:dienelactone hydrolase family protein [Gemmatimonadota bacterium]